MMLFVVGLVQTNQTSIIVVVVGRLRLVVILIVLAVL